MIEWTKLVQSGCHCTWFIEPERFLVFARAVCTMILKKSVYCWLLW